MKTFYQMNVKAKMVPDKEPNTFKSEEVPPVFISLSSKDKIQVMSGGVAEEQSAEIVHKKMARAIQFQVQNNAPPKALEKIAFTGEILQVGLDNEALQNAIALGEVIPLL